MNVLIKLPVPKNTIISLNHIQYKNNIIKEINKKKAPIIWKIENKSKELEYASSGLVGLYLIIIVLPYYGISLTE